MVLIRPQRAVARAVALADPGQIITIQGRTPHTPKSEGGRGSPGLGDKTTAHLDGLGEHTLRRPPLGSDAAHG
jgi:hypothetical protein